MRVPMMRNEGQSLDQKQRNQSTYIVFPDCYDIILRHPDASNAFYIIYRHITHNFACNITHCAISGPEVSNEMIWKIQDTNFLTRTQSRNAAVPAPDEKVCRFRTGKTGTSPRISAARERHCTTPVEPKRQRTMSFKFSTRLISRQWRLRYGERVPYVFNFSSISLRSPPSGSPSAIRSSLVSTNSLPSRYLIQFCLASLRRKTSDMAEQRTMLRGSCIFAILLIFF